MFNNILFGYENHSFHKKYGDLPNPSFTPLSYNRK